MRIYDRATLLKETLVLVMAGGRGERLYPLTRDRTKGAVPFGGMYRLIDFTLSNCLHSGLRRICVLPQYKFTSLERHLRLGWSSLFAGPGEGLALIPPQQRVNQEWYKGTADAVYHNIYTLLQEGPAHTLILSSDHIYRMDYGPFLEYHVRSAAELSIACMEVDLPRARRFGVMEVDAASRLTRFEEKPQAPRSLPCRPGIALASMGIYLFDTEALIEVLSEDCRREDSSHDFGRDVIPYMLADRMMIRAYDVQAEEGLDRFYWRDIGLIDAYWEASMELLESEPPFALGSPDWPIHTCPRNLPPAQILQGTSRNSFITEALVCPGAVVADAQVRRSLLSPGVVVDHQAEVVDSVLMDGVKVGAGARIRRAVIDKDVRIPAGARIGFNQEADQRSFHVSPGGIVVIPKETELRPVEEEQAAYAYFGCGNGNVNGTLLRAAAQAG